MRYGLIAGNGRFPFLVAAGARQAGASLSVVAIREETDPALEQEVERLTWVGIGQLGKMIRFFKAEQVEKAIMAGQVKHVQIFSGAVPDARMLKMLLTLPRRNTTSLIGAQEVRAEDDPVRLPHEGLVFTSEPKFQCLLPSHITRLRVGFAAANHWLEDRPNGISVSVSGGADRQDKFPISAKSASRTQPRPESPRQAPSPCRIWIQGRYPRPHSPSSCLLN